MLKPLPLLRELRESSELSLRALANKSGVAHDTINQIERGDRRARPATARKLADALDVVPFVLESRIEDLTSMTEVELYEWIIDDLAEEDLSNPAAADKAFNRVRSFLIETGARQEAAESGRDVEANIGKKSMALVEYLAALELVREADEMLKTSQDTPYEDKFIFTTTASLLLARASAQLLRYVTSELEDEANAYLDNDTLRGSERYLSSLSAADRVSRPLADAWIEGAAATRGLMDVIDKAPRLRGEKALEDESANWGGDQQEE